MKLRLTMPFHSTVLTRSALPAFVLSLLVVGTAPLSAREGGLFDSMFGGSERFSGSERPPQAEDRPVRMAQSDADLVVRLDRLENQIRQLTGNIEQLQFRNQQLEQQLRRSQEDIEFRFQELSGKGGARPRTASPPPAPPPQAAPPPDPRRRSEMVDPREEAEPPAPPSRRKADVFDPRENPAAPGAPRPLGSSVGMGAPASIATEEPDIGAPGGRQAGAPLDLSTLAERAARDPGLSPQMSPAPSQAPAGPLPAPPPSNPNATGAPRTVMAVAGANSPKEEFAIAQAFIQQKDYANAEDAFRDFLKKHPADRLAPDAHYWLGESLFQRQRYRDAAESFLAVSTKHEKSAKAPEALLRLGQSLAALGEKEASCATFAEVQRKFPKATSVKQGAEREQKRGRC